VHREAGERAGRRQHAEQQQDRVAHDGAEVLAHRAVEGAARVRRRDGAGRRLPHRQRGDDAGRHEDAHGDEPGQDEIGVGDVPADDHAEDDGGARDGRGPRDQPVRRAPVSLRPHAVDRPRLERAAGERRPERVDRLGDEAVGERVGGRVEPVRERPHPAADEERAAAPVAIGERARRDLEDEHRHEIRGEHHVDLEQVEPAAQQEQRIHRRDEELRQVVAAEDQQVRALGAGHGEWA
jgi:hypothetical protein